MFRLCCTGYPTPYRYDGWYCNTYSGGAVLRNASLASRLKVIFRVLSSGRFLEQWFPIFSTAKIQPFSAFKLLVFACIGKTTYISRTSKKRRAPLVDVDCTGSRRGSILVLWHQGRRHWTDRQHIDTKRTVLLTATLLKGCDFYRFVWGVKPRIDRVSYAGFSSWSPSWWMFLTPVFLLSSQLWTLFLNILFLPIHGPTVGQRRTKTVWTENS